MTTDLPSGWTIATIGDVADVQLGRQRSPQHHSGSQMRPYLRAANVTWNGVSLEDVKEMNFDDYDFATYRLEPGDLLLNEASGSASEVGKPAVWRGEIDDCCFQNTLLRLRTQAVDLDYLYWYCFFAALTGRFGEAGRGVNIRHLGKQGLMRFPIAIAPPAEQVRIVTAIEEHFTRLDAVELTVQHGLSSVAALKVSMLKEAFNIDRTLPYGWAHRRIGEIAEVQLGRQRSPQHHAGPKMRPYLRAANITWTGLSLDDVKEMNFDESDFETYRLRPGDLLLNEASGSPNEVGKPAVWCGEIEDCCFQNTLLRLRTLDVDQGYLYWYCVMAALTGRFGEAGRGVNIRHLGKQGLTQFTIVVAPRAEQEEIVNRLEEQLQLSSECEALMRVALERKYALRRSVLSDAFAGKLVSQDSEQKSASALLERIAASKEVQPKQSKTTA